MPKNAKRILIIVVTLLVAGILFDGFGQGVSTKISEMTTTEEEKKENKPTITFVTTPTYTVCTDESQLEAYDSLYFALITSCKDLVGNDILDADHVKYTEIDWMKKGEQTIVYTVTDDYGRTTKADCTVTLTDPLNTGH